MIKGQNIVCISSIDWDFIWQGHQEIMSAFASNGNRVIFIENTGVRTPKLKDFQRLKKRILNWFRSLRGFREERQNLYIYSPVILPFPYSRLARWVNKFFLIRPLKRWMKITNFYDPIMWTFLPTGIAMDIINSIERKLLVYYCIADFLALADSPKKLSRSENELIRNSDLVFVQGEVLKKRCEKLNKNVHIFTFGVQMDNFDVKNALKYKAPSDIDGIKAPIIGYVGGIHKHMDFPLIKFLADRHPEWSIVLVGPLQTDASSIHGIPNIHLLGKKDFSALPEYISMFDACIIPYAVNDYTKTVFPTKMSEYHAMGKPVVSVALPEVVMFNNENNNIVFIADTPDKFVECTENAMLAKDEALVNMRIASAKNNNWESKIESMSRLIEKTIEAKESEPSNWRDLVINFYRTSRRRFIKIVVAVLSVYIITFYTPLMWIVARPLKISDEPIKAQTIVVFAGGVGESGKAGQGYEERVQYAVELYKEGFADKLIFSSGFNYAIKETVVMKALALDMGVPDSAIILEDKASNTRGNVVFTKAILDQRGWNNILLVSSPYNMRRASMVFHKIAPDVKVSYIPIKSSLFYYHPNMDWQNRRTWRRITMEQIWGIAHEYIGIVYYWFKGYI